MRVVEGRKIKQNTEEGQALEGGFAACPVTLLRSLPRLLPKSRLSKTQGPTFLPQPPTQTPKQCLTLLLSTLPCAYQASRPSARRRPVAPRPRLRPTGQSFHLAAPGAVRNSRADAAFPSSSMLPCCICPPGRVSSRLRKDTIGYRPNEFPQKDAQQAQVEALVAQQGFVPADLVKGEVEWFYQCVLALPCPLSPPY